MPTKFSDRRPKRTFRQKIALKISGLDHAWEEEGVGMGVLGGGGGSDGCQAFQYLPAIKPGISSHVTPHSHGPTPITLFLECGKKRCPPENTSS